MTMSEDKEWPKASLVRGLRHDIARYNAIANRIQELVEATGPEVVIIEDYAYSADNAHSDKLRELGGLVKRAVLRVEKEKMLVAPMAISMWKKVATGSGNATKLKSLVTACKFMNTSIDTLMSALRFDERVIARLSTCVTSCTTTTLAEHRSKLKRQRIEKRKQEAASFEEMFARAAARNGSGSSSSGTTSGDGCTVRAVAARDAVPTPVQDIADAVCLAVAAIVQTS